MEAAFAVIFSSVLVSTCWLHYIGPINFHLKIGLWHLKQAQKIKERYEREEERILSELKGIGE